MKKRVPFTKQTRSINMSNDGDWLQPLKEQYGLRDKLKFGAYAGNTIQEILMIDPAWLVKALDTFDDFALSRAAMKKLDAWLEGKDNG